MKPLALGFAKLDVRIADVGLDAVVAEIITRVAEGENPVFIAKSFGVPYICIKYFMEEHSEMMALARRAHADVLSFKALDEVENANSDTVQVSRLRSETYLKVAGKESRTEWGESSTITVDGVIDLKGVVDAAESRLRAMRVIEDAVVIEDTEI